MNNGWDHAQGLADKHASSGGGLFVKLTNNGDKVVGSFVGEPYAREVHWSGERYEKCAAPDKDCSFCKEGKRPSLRVTMNFFVPADKEMKIIEGGVTWFKDLIKVRDKYGLNAWMFEIERHGEAGDPKTTYTILPEEKLTPDQIKEIESLVLHDLKKVVSGEGDSFDSYDKNGSGKTVDPRVASSLVARLKALPREAVDTFLGKFGVQRIRDMKASDESAAKAFVESLEAKFGQAKGGGGEVDPFA